MDKVCTKCLTDKPKSEFYAHGQNSGLHPWCKPCHKQASKECRNRNKDAVRKTAAAYRKRKRNHIESVRKEWRASDPERTKLQRRRDAAKEIEELANVYVAKTLNAKVSEIPPELIEAKRLQLKIKRYLKNGH